MLNIFNSIIPSTGITPVIFIILVIASLVLGGILALIHTYRNEYTKSFILTLAISAAVVCVVIMMVNGNIGAGVFSLVRFRSAPGTAREIGTLFAAMGMGLIMGMGYAGYAVLFTCLIGIATVLFSNLTSDSKNGQRRLLKITIPENLNYTDVFDGILSKYTASYKLNQVKTSNMGSLFKLSYEIILNDPSSEKEFIDDLRTRNGNLEISISEYRMQGTDQL